MSCASGVPEGGEGQVLPLTEDIGYLLYVYYKHITLLLMEVFGFILVVFSASLAPGKKTVTDILKLNDILFFFVTCLCAHRTQLPQLNNHVRLNGFPLRTLLFYKIFVVKCIPTVCM